MHHHATEPIVVDKGASNSIEDEEALRFGFRLRVRCLEAFWFGLQGLLGLAV